MLLAGLVNLADLRRQLSRWTKAGRLIQLRRGVYTLAPPTRRSNLTLSRSPIACRLPPGYAQHLSRWIA